jgi:hypothetical protein
MSLFIAMLSVVMIVAMLCVVMLTVLLNVLAPFKLHRKIFSAICWILKEQLVSSQNFMAPW